MKKILFFLALGLLIVPGFSPLACVRIDVVSDSGPTVTRTYDFTSFTGIEAGDAFSVEVTQAADYSISVTVSEKIADRLRVVKSGDTLKIGFNTPILNIRGRPSAVITMPDLRSLDLSGASAGSVRGFKSSNDFSLRLSGASSLDVDMEAGDFRAEISGASPLNGYLKARNSDINLSGASQLNLTGSGGNISLEASGASSANLENYPAGDADIQLSGASRGTLTVSGKLNANLSGASRLEYGGSPVLGKVEVTGGSTFKRK
jgi:hypothetical protein